MKKTEWMIRGKVREKSSSHDANGMNSIVEIYKV